MVCVFFLSYTHTVLHFVELSRFSIEFSISQVIAHFSATRLPALAVEYMCMYQPFPHMVKGNIKRRKLYGKSVMSLIFVIQRQVNTAHIILLLSNKNYIFVHTPNEWIWKFENELYGEIGNLRTYFIRNDFETIHTLTHAHHHHHRTVVYLHPKWVKL